MSHVPVLAADEALVPSPMRTRRKLSAILYADAVGFSRLTEENEDATLDALAIARELIAETTGANQGRVVSMPGDSVLAEFESAVASVYCGIEIQQRLSKTASNSNTPLQFRLGINIGEVVVDGEDILGEGVNIAARIQSLCNPGELCVSGAVYEQVKHKMDIECLDLGRQHLKNISENVSVYRVGTTTSEQALTSRHGGELQVRPSVLLTLDRPAIAVLPFENLSTNAEGNHIGDAIASSLIEALSRSRWFFVIARNTTFSYRDSGVERQMIGRELGVQYLISGTVQTQNQTVRVSVQLSDTTGARIVWNARYECAVNDVFEVQDTIAMQIAASVEPEIIAAEAHRSVTQGLGKKAPPELVMRAYSHLWRMTKEDCSIARMYLNEVLEIDCEFAKAYMGLALSDVLEIYMGWCDGDLEQKLENAVCTGRRAIALDKNDAWGYLALGLAYQQQHRLNDAIFSFKKAISLNSSFAMAYSVLAQALVLSGRPREAVPYLRIALWISPRDPLLVNCQVTMSMVRLAEGRYKDGAKWAKKAVREAPWWPGAHRLLAICCGYMGLKGEARAALAEMLRLQPGFSMAYLERIEAFRRPADFDRYVADLRLAGWSG